jgi:hypothetical protein
MYMSFGSLLQNAQVRSTLRLYLTFLFFLIRVLRFSLIFTLKSECTGNHEVFESGLFVTILTMLLSSYH